MGSCLNILVNCYLLFQGRLEADCIATQIDGKVFRRYFRGANAWLASWKVT